MTNLLFFPYALHEAPLSVSLTPRRQRVDVADSAELVCQIQGFPIHEIVWLRNGEAFLEDEEVEIRLRDSRRGKGFQLSEDRKVHTN